MPIFLRFKKNYNCSRTNPNSHLRSCFQTNHTMEQDPSSNNSKPTNPSSNQTTTTTSPSFVTSSVSSNTPTNATSNTNKPNITTDDINKVNTLLLDEELDLIQESENQKINFLHEIEDHDTSHPSSPSVEDQHIFKTPSKIKNSIESKLNTGATISSNQNTNTTKSSNNWTKVKQNQRRLSAWSNYKSKSNQMKKALIQQAHTHTKQGASTNNKHHNDNGGAFKLLLTKHFHSMQKMGMLSGGGGGNTSGHGNLQPAGIGSNTSSTRHNHSTSRTRAVNHGPTPLSHSQHHQNHKGYIDSVIRSLLYDEHRGGEHLLRQIVDDIESNVNPRDFSLCRPLKVREREFIQKNFYLLF